MDSIGYRVPRRGFLLAGVSATTLVRRANATDEVPDAARPKAIASENGLEAVRLSVERMLAGADPLDAAIAGVNINEDDPNDQTVGLGGLPNEDGVVELDSAVMHGPTARAGAVAALRNIKNPSQVAKLVMERTDHVLLVGRGALRFAKAHGFPEQDLLTEASRKAWLLWKETLSDRDDWLSSESPDKTDQSNRGRTFRSTGTIHLSAIDAKGNLGCCTTTSGLAFKIPGRVGDSPILGAGLYCDNDIGSAGSTGRGEANILTGASLIIVEEMRRGASPTDACMAACKRIAATTKDKRLLDRHGRPNFDVKFYALDKQGRHGSASLYASAKYALAEPGTSSLFDAAYLFEAKEPE